MGSSKRAGFSLGLALLLVLVSVLGQQGAEAFLPSPAARRAARSAARSKQDAPLRLWNPFAAAPEPSGSAVIDAVLAKQPATLKATLVRGKDAANEKDAAGNNAMHIIAKKGHYQFPPEAADSIPKLLIGAGIDLNAKNNENRTALEISLLSGWQRIAYLLLNSGADRTVVTQEVKSRITCPDCKRVVKEYSL